MPDCVTCGTLAWGVHVGVGAALLNTYANPISSSVTGSRTSVIATIVDGSAPARLTVPCIVKELPGPSDALPMQPPKPKPIGNVDESKHSWPLSPSVVLKPVTVPRLCGSSIRIATTYSPVHMFEPVFVVTAVQTPLVQFIVIPRLH